MGLFSGCHGLGQCDSKIKVLKVKLFHLCGLSTTITEEHTLLTSRNIDLCPLLRTISG